MGRPLGSPNQPGERIFGAALRAEIAEAGREGGGGRHGTYKTLRQIARNLLHLASQPEQAALPAIKEIADRLDGKARQETEITMRQAVARELTDDQLAAIACGASFADEQLRRDTNKGPSDLN
jgi:hypothetical protein